MHTKPTTTLEAFAAGALAAVALLTALFLAALVAGFAPVAFAHPVLSLVCALIGAGVLYAFVGERGGLTRRALEGAALMSLPLLALAAAALLLPVFSGVSAPDLGALEMPDVPGVVWFALALTVGGIMLGSAWTHDRAWGAVAGLPLAMLAVVALLFASAGHVPGLPGASEPHIRAGAEHAVSVAQGGAEEASGAWYDGASKALTGLLK